MGLSGISPLSLLLILAIVIALFGTAKLKTIGTDLGETIKNFRKAVKEDETNSNKKNEDNLQ